MKVRFFDIKWDTKDEETGETLDLADLDLPSECVVEMDDDVDVEEDGTDILSQEHGWLVESCSFEVV